MASTIAVSGAAYGCESVICESVITVTIRTAHQGEPHEETIRCFSPKFDGSDGFVERPFTKQVQAWHESGDFEEWSHGMVFGGLLMTNIYYSGLLERCLRTMSPKSLMVSPALKKHAHFIKCDDLPAHERIMAMGGKTTDADSELVRMAIYGGMPPDYPEDLSGYRGFRDGMLAELVGLRERQRQIVEAVFELHIGSEPIAGLDPVKRVNLISHIRDDIRRGSAGLDEIFTDVATRALKRGVALEQSRDVFSSMVAEADEILREITSGLFEARLLRSRASACKATKRVKLHLKKSVDLARIDNLLQRVIAQFDATYSGDRESSASPENPHTTILDEIEGVERLPKSSELRAAERNTLILFLDTADPYEKCCALEWVRDTLVNRTPHFRAFLREAYHVRMMAKSYGVKDLYRNLRKHLNRAEKRAFLFMHLLNYRFDSHIPMEEPVLISFFLSVPDDLKATLFRLVAQKDRSVTEEEKASLDNAWRAYMKFYPTWLCLVRSEEQNRSAKRRRKHLKEKSLEKLVEDQQAGARRDQFEKLCAQLDECPEFFEALARKYLTPGERSALLSTLQRERQVDAAEARGVTQQAVSIAFRRAIKKLSKAIGPHLRGGGTINSCIQP